MEKVLGRGVGLAMLDGVLHARVTTISAEDDQICELAP